MKKIDDNSLDQVSGGATAINDTSSLFKRNQITVCCDKCYAENTVKIPSDKIKSEWVYSPNATKCQETDFDWTCKKCKSLNHISAKRFGGLIFSGSWRGLNFRHEE